MGEMGGGDRGTSPPSSSSSASSIHSLTLSRKDQELCEMIFKFSNCEIPFLFLIVDSSLPLCIRRSKNENEKHFFELKSMSTKILYSLILRLYSRELKISTLFFILFTVIWFLAFSFVVLNRRGRIELSRRVRRNEKKFVLIFRVEKKRKHRSLNEENFLKIAISRPPPKNLSSFALFASSCSSATQPSKMNLKRDEINFLIKAHSSPNNRSSRSFSRFPRHILCFHFFLSALRHRITSPAWVITALNSHHRFLSCKTFHDAKHNKKN